MSDRPKVEFNDSKQVVTISGVACTYDFFSDLGDLHKRVLVVRDGPLRFREITDLPSLELFYATAKDFLMEKKS